MLKKSWNNKQNKQKKTHSKQTLDILQNILTYLSLNYTCIPNEQI